jgi:hypothetical protein
MMAPSHRNQSQHQESVLPRPGSYSPRIHAHYGRANGTYYLSPPVIPDAEGMSFSISFDYLKFMSCSTESEADDGSDIVLLGTHKAAPTTPSSLGIRKAVPTTPSALTTILTKRAKVEPKGSRGRARASDFDDVSKAVLEDAIINFRALISTDGPYPDKLEERDWAADCWVRSCEARNLRIEFDEDILKLVHFNSLYSVSTDNERLSS